MYKVTFNFKEGNCISLQLYSHYTCIYGKNSGEGISYLFSLLEDEISTGEVEIIVEPKLKFVLAHAIDIECLLTLQEKHIIMIDDFDMLREEVVRKINKSKHFIICASRNLPFRIKCPVYSLSCLEENNKISFDIKPVDSFSFRKR